ncbi:aminotransferase class I/II-fold pyridoxal phosphate-dependent enzyme [Cohnella sp. AR92]|uniref:aminotransferase class I/II-fold pyridoxal phosphate-dependent enzyme n=1 Tax=Cohnella sp. AR92 TaxID=648716 RepID=UPI000F8EA7B6|nr:aminotransferase class I/II-fold pyridoxal phosphate-dependent enzyme [Cohnella sp. AR92]RUS47219.1 aminotransferase class I/II-fold pyridoxal phosphate-dependent enzyme [Cohnella sp. AR92]
MNSNEDRAPLFDALLQHAKRKPASFHVPGHKQRETAYWAEDASIFRELLSIDLTELSDTDDLHQPEGVIAEAERLAARCFGAEESCLLVGGSTSGNLAMILGVCQPGELLLVQRNVHKSVIHGLILAGARAVFLSPEIDPDSGLALAPSSATVEAALDRYPLAKGLVLSNPNYYGQASDLSSHIAFAHERDIPVLVDEAHGPHFGRHAAFPMGSLSLGADAVVQSAHKMLSAMTMGAYLHLQGERVNRQTVRQYLRMVQSSSPSYPIMASLDLARWQVQTQGESLFNDALAVSDEIRTALALSPIQVLPLQGASFGWRGDPLKLVITDATGTLTGFELRDELESQGCLAEMADDRYVVLALGTGTRAEDGEALVGAVGEIIHKYGLQKKPYKENLSHSQIEYQAITEPPYSSPVAFTRHSPKTESLVLEEAEGRRCGEWIIPYPPGIPELYPGEEITAAAIHRLKQWRLQGSRIQGAEDQGLKRVRVIAEE